MNIFGYFVEQSLVIDALLKSVEKVNENPSILIKELSNKISNKEVVLVTGHRRDMGKVLKEYVKP